MNMRSRLNGNGNHGCNHRSTTSTCLRVTSTQGFDVKHLTRRSVGVSRKNVQMMASAPSVVAYFTDLGCSQTQLARMEQRLPQVFRLSLDDTIIPAVGFLQEDVGLSSEELPSVIARFPVLFTFGVKAHLKPQLAFLLSLGVQKHEVAALVATRPLVLGPGIDTVVRFLLRCGLPRRKVHLLLSTYPIDYGLHLHYQPDPQTEDDS